ncbi:Inner membrane protein YihN [compost metagenome]
MEAIKVPAIWLVSFNVFMVYIVYCGLTYFIPYLKEVYGLPVALVGAYGIINQYMLKILGGPAGGFIADKHFKSPSRYLKWAFLALLPMMAIILLVPKSPGFIYAGMAATLSFAFIVFSMRGVFWAPMGEVGIAPHITGSAFGIGCLIGYAPGMFAYVGYGAILDHFPGQQGYNYVFIAMMLLALIGFAIASRLQRLVRKAAPLTAAATA